MYIYIYVLKNCLDPGAVTHKIDVYMTKMSKATYLEDRTSGALPDCLLYRKNVT